MLHLALATLLPLLPFPAESWLQKLCLLLGYLLTVLLASKAKGVIKMCMKGIAASWLCCYCGYCLSHPWATVFPMQITGAQDAAVGVLAGLSASALSGCAVSSSVTWMMDRKVY